MNELKFPFLFDVNKLQYDLSLINFNEWIEHFNKNNYNGVWRIAPLRGPENETHPIRLAYPNPSAEKFVNLPLLEKCSYFKEVLDHFECQLLSVRLMNLTAGSYIKEHVDHSLGLEDGEIRIHIPVQTNPNVKFIHNGKRIIMNVGECWYLNFSLPHSISNEGTEDRVHMVIDCKVNDWIRKFFAEKAIL